MWLTYAFTRLDGKSVPELGLRGTGSAVEPANIKSLCSGLVGCQVQGVVQGSITVKDHLLRQYFGTSDVGGF